MKILITGASGFIGSFIVEEAIRQGMETWAAIRPHSSRQWLTDERIHFIELDFSSEQRLTEQLRHHQFDYIVHAAGVTKCLDSNDFYRVNTLGTRNLIRALYTLQMPVNKLVYLSSLSVFGAIREQQPYTEITPTDTPMPNTAYGKSKLQAEEVLRQETQAAGENGSNTIPYIVLRPTGVYGPREKDYFLMAKSIRKGVDFSVGKRQQDITFVYVQDVVQAVFLALKKGQMGTSCFLSDGRVYQSADFSKLLQQHLGRKHVLRICCPVWLLWLISCAGEWISSFTGKPTALNRDKFNILRQRNWRCDIREAKQQLGYSPRYQLEEGVALTVKWYREHGWI